MPYAPATKFDASPLYYGLRDAGAAYAAGQDRLQRKREMDLRYAMNQEDNARAYYLAGLDDQARQRELNARVTDNAADRAVRMYGIQEENKPYYLSPEELQAYKDSGYTPLRVSPRSFNALPGRAAVLQYGEDPTGSGDFYFDGKRLQQKRGGSSRPLDVGSAAMLGGWQRQLEEINKEIADHNAKIAEGDKRYGFLNVSSREERLKELMTQKAGLETQIGALGRGRGAAPAAAPAGNGTDKPSGTKGANKEQLLTEAREAIRRGASRAQVAERLKGMGIDPSSL